MTPKRQTSTKQDIQEALIQLLAEEKFENISVSKLCKRAGINRGTFYLHYEDKYQMIETIKTEVTDQLYSYFEEISDSTRSFLIANLHKVQENVRLINALTRSRYFDFREAIRDFMTSIILSDQQWPTTQLFLEDNFAIPQKYALEIFLSSIEGIISLWIAEGAQESPEEIAEIILRTYNYTHWRADLQNTENPVSP